MTKGIATLQHCKLQQYLDSIVAICSAVVVSVKTRALLRFTAMERRSDNCSLHLQISSVAKRWLSIAEATQTSLLYLGSVTIAKAKTY